jgi:hypothetical protein
MEQSFDYKRPKEVTTMASKKKPAKPSQQKSAARTTRAKKTKKAKRKQADSSFWEPKTLEERNAERVVEPFDPVKFREDVKGVWPEDESVDEFIAFTREQRRGSRAREDS